MDYKSLRIVFMGTPEFAVASLSALVNAGCTIVGVITAPDKPAGRGLKLQASAVKQYAVEQNLHILQPEKLKAPEFIAQLQQLKADIQIVVAFRMLPEMVWIMPPMGTINVHGSLLPQYRGAAPINWAVINGEQQTGVTTFKLKHEIDTGDILLQAILPITEDETAGQVHDNMKELGATLLVQTIQAIALNTIKEQPQTALIHSATKSIQHAPKIFTETCVINFAKSVNEVHNLIRGLSPFPGAFTYIDGKLFKIFLSKKEITTPLHPIGQLITDGKTYVKFACHNGYVHALQVQLEGKKKMNIEDFLRGNKL
jgi:methionyl-tRNA formyltransferase